MIVKSSGINNYIKCKWSKHYNQKVEIVKLDEIKIQLYDVYKKNTLNIKVKIG